jgi:hypothetical protein
MKAFFKGDFVADFNNLAAVKKYMIDNNIGHLFVVTDTGNYNCVVRNGKFSKVTA